MQSAGFSFAQAFLARWLFDLAAAGAFVIAYEKTGQDITLGEAYRNSTDVIFERSRVAGILATIWTIIHAAVWSGLDHVVVFFKKELATRSRTAVALVLLTAVQAAVWTVLYTLGYESVPELIAHYRSVA